MISDLENQLSIALVDVKEEKYKVEALEAKLERMHASFEKKKKRVGFKFFFCQKRILTCFIDGGLKYTTCKRERNHSFIIRTVR